MFQTCALTLVSCTTNNKLSFSTLLIISNMIKLYHKHITQSKSISIQRRLFHHVPRSNEPQTIGT